MENAHVEIPTSNSLLFQIISQTTKAKSKLASEHHSVLWEPHKGSFEVNLKMRIESSRELVRYTVFNRGVVLIVHDGDGIDINLQPFAILDIRGAAQNPLELFYRYVL